MQTSNGVYYKDINTDILIVNDKEIDLLIDRIKRQGLNYGRLCLHESPNDKLHIMIIAFIAKINYPVHKHQTKVESYTILRGKCRYITYSEESKKTNKTKVLGKGDILFNRKSRIYHTLEIIKAPLVFQEVTTGPLDQDSTIVLNEKID